MHDENVDFAHVVKEVGQEMAERIRDVTLKLYTEAAPSFAATKFIGQDRHHTLSSSAWTTTARST